MRMTILSIMTIAAITPIAASAQTAQSGAAASASAEARIEASIRRAENAGVPRDMLENKVAEGRAKGVAAARIAAAVEHRADVLARVRARLAGDVDARTPRRPADQPQRPADDEQRPADNAPHRRGVVTSAELVAAADAFEGGIDLNSIATLSARAGNQRAAALSVLADLVASGRTSPSQALLRVETALNGGASALARLDAATPPRPQVAATSRTDATATAARPGVATTVTSATGIRVGH